MTFCNKESCAKTCPIQFFCRFLKVSSKERLSSTIPNICSFDACCFQAIFIIHRQIHISKASRLLISSCLNVQVSLPYKTTLQTRTLIILFFSSKLNDPLSNCFFFWKQFCIKQFFFDLPSYSYHLLSPNFPSIQIIQLGPACDLQSVLPIFCLLFC